MAIAGMFGATNGVGIVTMNQWTVIRMGADARNQLTKEHMLALVEGYDHADAESATLNAPGVTVYPGQWLRVQGVIPSHLPPRRLERALNANLMRERLGAHYDDWVIGAGKARLNRLKPAQRAYVARTPKEVFALASGETLALAGWVPTVVRTSAWLHRETAYLLRKRATGACIYVIDTGVWVAPTDDPDDPDAFAKWLCGPYRDGAVADRRCLAPENGQQAGWSPLKDRSYDAVAIARRVGEDRVKVLVLGGGDHWYDTEAQPAPAVARLTVYERWMAAKIRSFTSFKIGLVTP